MSVYIYCSYLRTPIFYSIPLHIHDENHQNYTNLEHKLALFISLNSERTFVKLHVCKFYFDCTDLNFN